MSTFFILLQNHSLYCYYYYHYENPLLYNIKKLMVSFVKHAMIIIVIKYTCIVNNWFLMEICKSISSRWISSFFSFFPHNRGVKYTCSIHPSHSHSWRKWQEIKNSLLKKLKVFSLLHLVHYYSVYRSTGSFAKFLSNINNMFHEN